MMGRHVWLRLNPSSLLKLSGCSRISIASLTRQSMYLIAVLSWEVPSKSMRWYVVNECSATADLWLVQADMSPVLPEPGLDGPSSLPHVDFPTFTGDTVNSCGL
jgi:hypothetical protein